METQYQKLKAAQPARTLGEIFDQFEQLIRLPECFENKAVKFSETTGQPIAFEETSVYSESLLFGYSVEESLILTNTFKESLRTDFAKGKRTRLYKHNELIYLIQYSDYDGYIMFYVSRPEITCC